MENENKNQDQIIKEEADEIVKMTIKEKMLKNKSSVILVTVFSLLVLGSFAYSYQKDYVKKNETAIKEKTEKFIKENLLQPGTDLEVTEFVREGSLFKLTVLVGGQSTVTYVTKDGKRLLLNPVELDKEVDKSASSSNGKSAVAEAQQKKDIPEVELFVMSYCPYGVQAEKGILPVVKKLGSKVDFKIKFVDYILHGKKEVDENLNQYCIQREEPNKFADYLECFAKESDSAKCLVSAKINKSKLTACIASTDKEFKITENVNKGAQNPAFDIHKKENDAYGVQGSPTLVVNGTVIDSQRDPDSYMKAICSGFSNKPEECNNSISSVAPAPGFGK